MFLSAPTESDSGKSLTFEIAPYVFDFLRYEERDEISPFTFGFCTTDCTSLSLRCRFLDLIRSSLAADG